MVRTRYLRSSHGVEAGFCGVAEEHYGGCRGVLGVPRGYWVLNGGLGIGQSYSRGYARGVHRHSRGTRGVLLRVLYGVLSEYSGRSRWSILRCLGHSTAAQRRCSEGYEVGTQLILSGYSVGTQWVLSWYSVGTKGYSVGTKGYSVGTQWGLLLLRGVRWGARGLFTRAHTPARSLGVAARASAQ